MFVSGVSTGSVYNDLILRNHGFPAEGVANGSVIVVKTHNRGRMTMELFSSAILLVRDPFSSLLAEFNRRSGGHTGHASQGMFSRDNGEYWHEYVVNMLKEWEAMNSDWINNCQGPLLVIKYSDMMDRLEEQLRRILDFLAVVVTKKEMECMLSRREGIYRRQKERLKIADPLFNYNLTNIINLSKERVFKLVKQKLM
jgi:hypothetical protein